MSHEETDSENAYGSNKTFSAFTITLIDEKMWDSYIPNVVCIWYRYDLANDTLNLTVISYCFIYLLL
jgi:hypothetical protein